MAERAQLLPLVREILPTQKPQLVLDLHDSPQKSCDPACRNVFHIAFDVNILRLDAGHHRLISPAGLSHAMIWRQDSTR